MCLSLFLSLPLPVSLQLPAARPVCLCVCLTRPIINLLGFCWDHTLLRLHRSSPISRTRFVELRLTGSSDQTAKGGLRIIVTILELAVEPKDRPLIMCQCLHRSPSQTHSMR